MSSIANARVGNLDKIDDQYTLLENIVEYHAPKLYNVDPPSFLGVAKDGNNTFDGSLPGYALLLQGKSERQGYISKQFDVNQLFIFLFEGFNDDDSNRIARKYLLGLGRAIYVEILQRWQSLGHIREPRRDRENVEIMGSEQGAILRYTLEMEIVIA
jgi:hypothetical protein